MSHQNLRGNTILHEAVLEGRDIILGNLKSLQLVKQNIKNNKGFTFKELHKHLRLSGFKQRYETTSATFARNERNRRKRCWNFWEMEDDEEYEESIRLIKL